MMNTDVAWEAWGRSDPYYGVITDPRFRLSEIDADTKRVFFESGSSHADYVMQMIKQHIDPAFAPGTILDFGCGVGRILIPFGKMANQAIGMDVSSSMLLEARKNCAEYGAGNIKLIVSDDELTLLTGQFDLIHSFIVFQHIPVVRGRAIFARLLEKLAPNGIGAMHFSYAKSAFASSYGAVPPELVAAQEAAENAGPAFCSAGEDPEMQMNSYALNDLLFIMQSFGVHRFHVEFTDHGGERGVFLFFRRPQLTG